jgi:L-seryl-tRNA(Ser) seleniumtransferase
MVSSSPRVRSFAQFDADAAEPSRRAGRYRAGVVSDARRHLPSVEAVRQSLDGVPRAIAVRCSREAVEAARRLVEGGTTVDASQVFDDARRRAIHAGRTTLRPLINATGVLLHTNLGRAPLSEDALQAVHDVAHDYCSLEYDVEAGERGSRHAHAAPLLAALTGAEDGLVVNNNAAAVLLVLGAIAADRPVIVSRGELIEIGGGFRIPEIIAASGCRLVEVGTTNRTRVADYRRAMDDGAVVLKVHTSNYRVVGFTEDTTVRTLTTLGAPIVVDLGSGLLDERVPWLPERPAWLGDEPGVRQSLDAGADVVTFSGDKLLGGPQAGIVVGKATTLDLVRRHPLARAMRVDKMTLAALEVVLRAYLRGDASDVPFWAMATRAVAELRARATAIAASVPSARVVELDATVGGGSVPGARIPSAGLAIDTADGPDALATLRDHAIVARVHDGAVVADLRTVDARDDAHLAKALLAIAR